MVLVTKSEKEIIKKAFPDICVVRTVKQKSKRHCYYCEESKGAMELLAELRKPTLVGGKGE